MLTRPGRYVRWALGLSWALLAFHAGAQDVRVDTLAVLSASNPVPGSGRVTGDFNGDRISDITFTNPFTLQVGYWTMTPGAEPGVYLRSTAKTFDISPGYAIGAMGDFNGDGLADLMLTSAARDLYLWTNDGHGNFTKTYVDSYPAGWQLVGAGDIDGDGSDDLLWLNPQGCQFGYWLMKAGKRVGSRIVPVTCGYVPLAVGYFSPTPRLSIIWSSSLRDLYVWDSVAGGGFASYPLGTYPQGTQLGGINGGTGGTGIRVVTLDGSTNSTISPSVGHVYTIDRSFDMQSRQVSFTTTQVWDEFAPVPWSAAGTIVDSRATPLVAPIEQYGNDAIALCPPGVDDGWLGTSCTHYAVPRGWFIPGTAQAGVILSTPGVSP